MSLPHGSKPDKLINVLVKKMMKLWSVITVGHLFMKVEFYWFLKKQHVLVFDWVRTFSLTDVHTRYLYYLSSTSIYEIKENQSGVGFFNF